MTMSDETRETADLPPAETSNAPTPRRRGPRRETRDLPPAETAVESAEPEVHPTKRPGWVPRHIRMQRHALRVNPRASQVRVLRSWQGVRNGQIVVLHPTELKRRLKSGMVEVVNAQ